MNNRKINIGFTGLAAVLAVVASLLPVSPVAADIVKMKDGTVYDGEIKQALSTADMLFMVVKSGGISDDKKLQRSLIAEIKILGEDEKEFAKWGNLKDTRDRMGVVDYETVIREKFMAFLGSYPNSKHVKEVEELRKQYEEEKNKVKDGWLQLENRWIDPKEMEWNKYCIDAKIILQDLNTAIAAVRMTDAANHGLDKVYERLNKLWTEYRGTPSYTASVLAYDAFIKKQQALIEEATRVMPALIKKKEEMVRGQTATQLDIIKADDKAKETMLFDVNRSFTTLVPKVPLRIYNPLDVKSLAEGTKFLKGESDKLMKLAAPGNVALLTTATNAIAEAIQEQSKGNATLAFTLMDKAMNMDKPAFAIDKKLKSLHENMKKASDAAAKILTTVPSSSGAATTPTASGTTAPAKPSAPTSTSLSGKSTDDKAKATAGDKPASTTTKIRSAPPEEGMGMGTIAGIVLGALALVGGLMAAFGKKKKSDD